jgi:hypothetical protein
VQQTAITPQQSQPTSAQAVSTELSAPTIVAPNQSSSNSDFPSRWKSMTTGNLFTVRLGKDSLYAERILPESAVKAGMFFLTETKYDGEKYVGKINGRMLKTEQGPACSISSEVEITSVTPERIEGRAVSVLPNSKLDWDTCAWSPPMDWQAFVWIPVK